MADLGTPYVVVAYIVMADIVIARYWRGTACLDRAEGAEDYKNRPMGGRRCRLQVLQRVPRLSPAP